MDTPRDRVDRASPEARAASIFSYGAITAGQYRERLDHHQDLVQTESGPMTWVYRHRDDPGFSIEVGVREVAFRAEDAYDGDAGVPRSLARGLHLERYELGEGTERVAVEYTPESGAVEALAEEFFGLWNDAIFKDWFASDFRIK